VAPDCSQLHFIFFIFFLSNTLEHQELPWSPTVAVYQTHFKESHTPLGQKLSNEKVEHFGEAQIRQGCKSISEVKGLKHLSSLTITACDWMTHNCCLTPTKLSVTFHPVIDFYQLDSLSVSSLLEIHTKFQP